VEFDPNGSFSLKSATRQAVREFEGKIILQALHANQWNRRRAAQSLNISYRALLYKIKAFKTNPEAQPESTPVKRVDRVGKDKALPN
jgi:DNA-binding NtrC family response regulator